MILAINIEDLLDKQKIESNRIEFQKVGIQWAIYNIYAFANDDNLSNSYVLTN